MKRNRIDGHISKAEYEKREDSAVSDVYPGIFSKATPNTLSSRRKVSANKVDKKQEFLKHVKALNRAYSKWFKEQLAKDPYALLVDAAQDYSDYSAQLKDRYLRTYGEVLTFGSGDCGQLAHGIEKDEDLMVKFPRIVYSLRGKHVCTISCGGLHNAVSTEQGLVYTWGCSDDGSLGREGEETLPLLVTEIAQETVISVGCGDGQTVAVTATGRVWGWGAYKDKEGKKWFHPSSSASGSIKDILKQQNTPILIQGLNGVVEIACGSVFNLARCEDGSILSFGLGECGELGRDVSPMKKDGQYDKESILKHHLSPGHMYEEGSTSPLQDAKTVGCGAYHSLLLLGGRVGEGQLLTCGLNNYGQLGTGTTDSTSRLVKVRGLEHVNIVSVKGGMHHSLVLTSDGVMWAFGRGDSGQLGIGRLQGGSAGDFTALPEVVSLPSSAGPVQSIACGANHNIALTTRNEVYSWGYGDMLALGHGRDRDEPTPKRLNFKDAKLDNITVKQVACGGQHSAIIGSVLSA